MTNPRKINRRKQSKVVVHAIPVISTSSDRVMPVSVVFKVAYKIANLQKLGYIVITQKGRANLIIITDEGTSALENWRKTTAGEKIITEIEKELEKTFKPQ